MVHRSAVQNVEQHRQFKCGVIACFSRACPWLWGYRQVIVLPRRRRIVHIAKLHHDTFVVGLICVWGDRICGFVCVFVIVRDCVF